LESRYRGKVGRENQIEDIQAGKEGRQWCTKIGVPKFQWQSGYGVFPASHSVWGAVETSIRNQAEHHAKFSYQDEFRRLWQKHGIEIGERYVWDSDGVGLVQIVGPNTVASGSEPPIKMRSGSFQKTYL